MILIIDHVNNTSGAPIVAGHLRRILNARIVCVRETSTAVYTSECYGLKSDNRWSYPFACIALMLNYSFWILVIKADKIILNTSLTFPVAFFLRALRKKFVLFLHESAKKNLLYTVSIFLSVRLSEKIVTPTQNAYLDLALPDDKWTVISDPIADDFRQHSNMNWIASSSSPMRVLFAGGNRNYKGGALFDEIIALRPDAHLLFIDKVGSESFSEEHGDTTILTPEIYSKYHVVLNLTNNIYWKETFGLIGVEGALCGSLPVYTDAFAYEEIWNAVSPNLLVGDYRGEAVIQRLTDWAIDKENFEKTRALAHQKALEVTSPLTIYSQWNRVLWD